MNAVEFQRMIYQFTELIGDPFDHINCDSFATIASTVEDIFSNCGTEFTEQEQVEFVSVLESVQMAEPGESFTLQFSVDDGEVYIQICGYNSSYTGWSYTKFQFVKPVIVQNTIYEPI